ncbi:hypothetical protein JCM19379_19870 [Methyloparacoccus murrellii]
MHSKFIGANELGVQAQLAALEARLADFYNQSGSQAYFESAQRANQHWPEHSAHAILYRLVQEGMAVLDLGCGTGVVAQHLTHCPIRYTGMDWSHTALAMARSVLAKAARSPIQARFEQGSIYETGLPSQSFDVVVSFFVIEHLTRPHHFLAEAARLVKEDGYLFLICPDYRRFGRMPSLPLGGPGSLKEKLRKQQYGRAMGHLALALYWKLMTARLGAWPIWTEPTCFSEAWRPDADAVYLASRGEISRHVQALGYVDETHDFIQRYAIQLNPVDAVVVARRTGKP